jgi:hypothetical protein
MSTREIIYAAAGAESYWFSQLSSNSSTLVGWDIAVSDLANIYTCGYGGATAYPLIVKYNSNGVAQWQKELAPALYTSSFYSCTIDTSENIYLTGLYDASGSGTDVQLVVVKYDSSGAVTWQKTLDHATLNIGIYSSITNDGVGNLYVNSQLNSQPTIYKYNSSGTLQWNFKLTISNVSMAYSSGSIVLDSSSNSFIIGYQGSPEYAIIVKVNSSGTLQWIKKLSHASNGLNFYGIAIDSNDEMYAVGYVGTTDSQALIVKYDTSGAVVWQSTLSSSGEDMYFVAAACDENDNVYAYGTNETTAVLVIVKYDSSGTLLWQRTLNHTPNGAFPYGITVKNLSVYLSGIVYGTTYNTMLTVKLPTSGALTGTYGSYVYASSSYTDASSSYTEGTISNSSTTDSYTEATSTFTASTTTYTSTTTSI